MAEEKKSATNKSGRGSGKKARKKTAAKRAKDCRLYVIELDPRVRAVAAFDNANPDARPDKPCLYVGITAKTPEERFAQHKAGIRASRYVRDFGVRLRPRYYQFHPLMTRAQALRAEQQRTQALRARGFAVWSN